MFFFFFSSRRRHTRWPRDWSSDVCSSDLVTGEAGDARAPAEILLIERLHHPDHLAGSLNARRRFRERLAAESRLLRVTEGAVVRSEERRVGKECRSGWGAEQ